MYKYHLYFWMWDQFNIPHISIFLIISTYQVKKKMPFFLKITSLKSFKFCLILYSHWAISHDIDRYADPILYTRSNNTQVYIQLPYIRYLIFPWPINGKVSLRMWYVCVFSNRKKYIMEEIEVEESLMTYLLFRQFSFTSSTLYRSFTTIVELKMYLF